MKQVSFKSGIKGGQGYGRDGVSKDGDCKVMRATW